MQITKLTDIYTEQGYIFYRKTVTDFASMKIDKKNINLNSIKFLNSVKWFTNWMCTLVHSQTMTIEPR